MDAKIYDLIGYADKGSVVMRVLTSRIERKLPPGTKQVRVKRADPPITVNLFAIYIWLRRVVEEGGKALLLSPTFALSSGVSSPPPSTVVVMEVDELDAIGGYAQAIAKKEWQEGEGESEATLPLFSISPAD